VSRSSACHRGEPTSEADLALMRRVDGLRRAPGAV